MIKPASKHVLICLYPGNQVCEWKLCNTLITAFRRAHIYNSKHTYSSCSITLSCEQAKGMYHNFLVVRIIIS